MGNFLETAVSPVASSLVLAHTLPQTAEEAAPTTRAYYLTSQRMDIKTTAMKAWSEALCETFVKAGGRMPAPVEGPRRSKLHRDFQSAIQDRLSGKDGPDRDAPTLPPAGMMGVSRRHYLSLR